MADSKEAAQVMSITIYPLKSCRGISVPEAALSSTGFRWDRQWIVVNSKGRACTQRVEPSLALIEVELPNEAFSEGWEPNPSSFLVSQSRPTDPNYAPGYKIKFNDAYPFLLISQKSLDVLNEQLKEPVSINRFRPNILIDGSNPFCEDLWKDVKIGENTFHSTELCYRCKVPTINQETAEAGSEPSETLMKFRSDKVLKTNKKPQGRIYFGQMLVWEDYVAQEKRKTIKVGDPVYVLKMVSSYDDVSV
ncbi:mitochondrial amidoxime-reducing component 1-like isoform X2 [Solanum tuberosum]|uniref:mitochondrial amidoxime-reducing component 1-like isoform X2 n=1 Tax=Solanum tuberosum TaxID=4113 RepID=UPI0003D268F3|nr:PREDICTED: mitochondrial amidoxime-reducing component 1-like isoform X2 [Solanum tuberosum]